MSSVSHLTEHWALPYICPQTPPRQWSSWRTSRRRSYPSRPTKYSVMWGRLSWELASQLTPVKEARFAQSTRMTLTVLEYFSIQARVTGWGDIESQQSYLPQRRFYQSRHIWKRSREWGSWDWGRGGSLLVRRERLRYRCHPQHKWCWPPYLPISPPRPGSEDDQ